MTQPDLTALRVECTFCHEHTRPRPVSQVGAAIGAYLAHLIESHWDELERLHNYRMAGGPVTDTWKRI